MFLSSAPLYSAARTVEIVDIRTWTQVGLFTVPNFEHFYVPNFYVSPNRGIGYVGHNNYGPDFYFIDNSSGNLTATWQTPLGSDLGFVVDGVFSPDGQSFWYLHSLGIKKVDLVNRTVTKYTPGAYIGGGLTSVYFGKNICISPDGNTVATAGLDAASWSSYSDAPTIAIINTQTPPPPTFIRPGGGNYQFCRFLTDKNLMIWDPGQGGFFSVDTATGNVGPLVALPVSGSQSSAISRTRQHAREPPLSSSAAHKTKSAFLA